MRTAHRKAARHKREQRGYLGEPELIGFGLVHDCITGRMRNWYQNEGGPKRWADNDEPVDEMEGSSERAAVFE